MLLYFISNYDKTKGEANPVKEKQREVALDNFICHSLSIYIYIRMQR